MRKFLLSLSLGCGFLSAFGQTTLQGIINQYAAVIQIDTCDNSLQVSSAADFLPGQSILIIQMQGASINTSNSASFGDITQLGSAGLFEKALIQSVNGNTITLVNAIVNTYAPAGKVQIVSFPVFDAALVTGALAAQPWNGQTGGVLALEVSGTLTLQADIDISGSGFRGGSADINDNNDCSWLVNVNNYSYPLNDWRGAAKGEGIATWITGAEAGRGAQANGGGGGNDHNAGGGGGANTSAGGQGGNNDEPSTFGCDGFSPGRGGKALAVQPNRLFMGGGGGAGHENNNLGTPGGRGGGIGFILAGQIAGNGFAIRSNGTNATEALSDGAGGGGGGGSLRVSAGQWSGPLTLEARGGNGGNVNNANADRCQGPGGGGSGGRVLHNLAGLTPVIGGGSAGLTLHSASCPDGPNGAQAGSNGISGVAGAILQGQQTNTPPLVLNNLPDTTLCAGQLLVAQAEVSGFDLAYQWQVNTGNGFVNISNLPPYTGAQSPQLSLSAAPAGFDQYQYRLQLSSACFPVAYSNAFTITVNEAPQAGFTYAAAGLSIVFSEQSVGADSYLWDFGDGIQSNEANPEHTYASGGAFTVQLTVANACGQSSVTQMLELSNPPQAGFAANRVEGCAPLLVTFENQSTGDYNQLNWFFEGAEPASSTALMPAVVYTQAGQYQVTLVVTGPAGADTLQWPQFIEVLPAPTAEFSYSGMGNQVAFFNNSTNAETYLWNFGDGQTSTEENPVHVFSGQGPYEVTLNAENAFCANATGLTVYIQSTGVSADHDAAGIKIFPNPFGSQLIIELTQPVIQWPALAIYNPLGQLHYYQSVSTMRTEITTEDWAPGVYFLRYYDADILQGTFTIIKK